MKNCVFFIIIAVFLSCNDSGTKKSEAEYKKEIIKTEKEFEAYCGKNGIANGFYTFADSNAVIKLKNDSLLQGKINIKKHFEKTIPKNTKVIWDADFVEVSKDGTLAYTYGKYVWTVTDSLGTKKDFTGVFHTVWKKQKDGRWKYVWD
jgi:ketosteroid isomerase-like protein